MRKCDVAFLTSLDYLEAKNYSATPEEIEAALGSGNTHLLGMLTREASARPYSFGTRECRPVAMAWIPAAPPSSHEKCVCLALPCEARWSMLTIVQESLKEALN